MISAGDSTLMPGVAHRPSRTVTKPLLDALALAIEEFALAPSRDRPMAVVGLVQRSEYLRPALGVWDRLAAVCGDGAPSPPSATPPTGSPTASGTSVSPTARTRPASGASPS
ncbi:hypothetical protein [Pseudonocardia alni]|uniref:hypothetical protein n=1 Tax=Pseudonocardia TaxID=1847 RepID=UPI00136DE833|nr:hypothetical protein [Pseudonocardia sp. SID8383]MYW76455.1 hypothetical protein [Pseudonocardia sp. SID8383]